MKKIFTSFIAVLLTTICAVAQLPYNTVMTQSHFNDGNTTIKKQGTTSWSNGVRLGDATWGGFNHDDKYVDIALNTSGIPGVFSATTSGGSTGIDYRLFVSSNNSNYVEIWKSESKDNTINQELPKDTKYIRLFYSGNFAGNFTNIKVTELIEVKDPAKKTLDADTAEINTENTTISTTMEWCNTPAFNLSIDGEDDSQFTASISNNASKGKYGTATIYVTYKHNILGTHNATLTISNGAFTKTITLKGTTKKKTPYLLWKQDLLEKLPLNEVVTDAAYIPNGQDLPIIYSSSNEEVLRVNGNSFTAVGEGTATITASTEETDDYYAATLTKTFTVTVKKIQSIVWSDNLTRLKIGDQPITLGATVQLIDSTGNKYDSSERTALLTYTSANNNVVSVSGNVLTIEGEGETTLTAQVPGDDEQEIEPASVTIPVKVRQQLSSGCEDVLLLNNNSEHELFSGSLSKPELTTSTFAINTSLGIPGLLTFQYKGEKYWTGNYTGTIKAQQSTNGGSTWTDIAGSEVTPTVGTYQTHTVSLDRKATHIRFVRPQGGEGYHYVKGILVTPAQYLETDIKSISENSIVGATILKNININYSNVKGEVTIAKSHPNVLISAEYLEDVECGDFGTRTLQVGIIPTEFGTINDEIVISDAVSGKKAIIPITINVSRDNQTIVWEQTTDIKTTDAITLTAEAKTNITYTSSNTEVADIIEDNKLVIKTAGTVTITAKAEETKKYKAATAQKTFNISKATPAIVSLPTVKAITYGATLEAATLNGGETDTEGTWQWNADLTQVLNAGSHELAVQFIPTNTAWYNTLDSKVTVTVNKADQTIAWDFTTTEMTVDETLTLNANATAGEVTFALTGDAATLEGNTLTAVKAGEVTITASQAGNDNYNAAEEVAHTITINKATPTITAWPTLNDVVYGATYGEALQLVGGEASVEGAFSITNMPADLAQVPAVGEYTFGIVFTPAKAESYNEVSDSVTLQVTKQLQTIAWDFADQELLIGNTLTLSATAPAGEVSFAIQPAEGVALLEGNTLTALAAGTVTITATAPENENYEAASVSYTVTVIKHTPEIVTLPTVAPLGHGTALADTMLNGGESNIEGTWSFVNPTQSLNMGNNEVAIRFTPTNTDLYNTIEATITIVVEKAETIIYWELESNILYLNDEIFLYAETANGDVITTFEITGPQGILQYDSEWMSLTAIGYGTTEVTAYYPETETHKAAELSYEITVFDPNSETTGITNTTITGKDTEKVFINGQLFIIRNNQWYDTTGKLVK